MCFMMAAGAGMAGAMSAITGIASIGVGIMQAAAANQAAAQQYQDQVRYRQEQEVQAQKTLNEQVSQQQSALESEKGKAQGEMADAAIEAYAAESRAMTGAAESGIVGLSVNNLIGSLRGEQARFNSKVQYNAKVGTQNAENELRMAQRTGRARLAEIPIPTKPKFNSGLQIATAVLSGLSSINYG